MQYLKSSCSARRPLPDSHLHGVLTAGDFLFPQYIEKYTNFAISICRVGALALSNAQKYENLLRSKNEITYISYHDALTGLFNRSYFKQSLEEHARAFSLAIFVCDIDKLKFVNDTFGHIEGDHLICMAANALKNCFRESDVVARIGGDEFAILVPECSQQMAEMLKDRLNIAIQKQNENAETRPYQLGLSAGYAIKETRNSDIEAVFHQADVNMYDEKMRKKQSIE